MFAILNPRLWLLAGLSVLLVLSLGCTSIAVDDLPDGGHLPLLDAAGVAPDQPHVIRPGDNLDIKFFYTPELNEVVQVRPDGYITLQLVNDVMAAGRTMPQLTAELTERYSGHINAPVLSVIARSFQGYRAYIGGEVATPQVVSLEGGLSVLQGIYRAGGLLPTAYRAGVILIRPNRTNGRPVPYHLDLSDDTFIAGKPDSRVALAPSDILYIPRSPIANANLWVHQYISELLLFKGINIGGSVNYDNRITW